MKRAALTLVCLAGCTTWTDAQLGLVEQARRGTTLLAESNDRLAAERLATLRSERRALDTAFDADVRTAELTPDWVIALRKAYAVGLDALHQRELAQARAAHTDRRNADATLAALDRLAWLLHLQRRAARLQPLENDHAQRPDTARPRPD
ncbi:MAG: hypothetical protein AAF743_09660 [Planctomycetota bacterium]